MLKERNIRIRDLFWGILSHWKGIIIFILIGAVAGAGYSYMTSGKGQSSAPGVNMKVGEQQKAVIALYVKYAALYADQIEYMQSDPLMEIDPANTYRCSTIYYLGCEDADKVDGIVAAYNIRLLELSDKYGLPNTFTIVKNPNTFATKDLRTIVTGEDTNCVISVVVYGTSPSDCTMMIDEADSYIFEIKDEVDRTFGKHTVTPFKGEMSKAPMTGIIARQKEAVDALNSINTNMTNIKKNQDADMVAILEYSAENHPEYENPENIPDKISTSESETKKTKSSRGISKRMVALGGAGALIIALILFAIVYSMRGKIAPEDDIEAMFGIPHLAAALHTGRKKRNALDASIYRKRCRNLPKTDEEGEAVLAASNIRISCQLKDVRKVFAFGSNTSDAEKAYIEKVAELLKEDGIELSAGRNILIFPDDLESAAEAGNVILVEKNCRSRFDDIVSEIRKCADHHINILGMITTG